MWLYKSNVRKEAIMSRLPKIAGCVVGLMLLVAQIPSALAADPPVLIGPDTGTAGENITYEILNPGAESLQLFTENGIWIKAIIADNGVSCTLNDQGTMVKITCGGSFRVTIASDYGQYLRFILGTLSKDVQLTGEVPVADASQVRIYNGAISPVSPLPDSSASQIPTVTNMLAGDTATYLLTTSNVTTPVSDTYSITLSIPAAIVSMGPRGCTATSEAGVFTCTLDAMSSDWLPSSFNTQWTTRGTYTMSARMIHEGKQVGYYDYTANVIAVEHYGPRQYLPLARR